MAFTLLTWGEEFVGAMSDGFCFPCETGRHSSSVREGKNRWKTKNLEMGKRGEYGYIDSFLVGLRAQAVPCLWTFGSSPNSATFPNLVISNEFAIKLTLEHWRGEVRWLPHSGKSTCNFWTPKTKSILGICRGIGSRTSSDNKICRCSSHLCKMA